MICSLRQCALTLLCCAAASPLCACAPDHVVPLTQVMIVVHSDLGGMLDEVTVEVKDEAGAQTQDQRPFSIAMGEPNEGQVELPFSFSLIQASENPAARFRLVVTGWSGLGSARDPDMIVRQTAIASFHPGATVRLTVFLGQTCLQEFCGELPDQTCYPETLADVNAGQCGTVRIQDDLPIVVPGQERAGISWPVSDRGAVFDAGDASSATELDAEAGGEPDPERDAEAGVESDPAPDGGGDGAADANTEASVEPESSACDDRPCQNAGQCSGDSKTRRCDCTGVDYQGDNCETKIDDCAVTPCARGTCRDGMRTRSCDCSGLDYDGLDCNSWIDDCERDPCAHGICTDGLRSRSCECKDTGFSDARCSTNVDECKGTNVCTDVRYPCVDLTGDVAGYTCRGQAADWPPTTSVPGRFSASSGVVTDSQTGLRWQQTIDSTLYPSTASVCPSGWRAPSLPELLSLVDYTKVGPASSFPGMPSAKFWTADPKYYVNMATGFASNIEQNGSGQVLCLR